MEYHLHKDFIKSYRKLPLKLRTVVEEKLAAFCEDPHAKVLNNHTLSGNYKGYRSINVTGDYRAIYKAISESEVVFVILGTHAQLYG